MGVTDRGDSGGQQGFTVSLTDSEVHYAAMGGLVGRFFLENK